MKHFNIDSLNTIGKNKLMVWKKLCFFILFFVLSPSIHSQEKEKTFFSDLYFEMNAGLNRITYYSNIGHKSIKTYGLRRENFLNIETNLKYRNDYFKLALGTTAFGPDDAFTNAFGTIGVNVLGLSLEYKAYYLGPFIQLGIDLDRSSIYYHTENYTKVGLETYIKNIHFSIYFSQYNLYDKNLKDYSIYYYPTYYSYLPVRSFGFDLGYSIPFKRKNHKK